LVSVAGAAYLHVMAVLGLDARETVPAHLTHRHPVGRSGYSGRARASMKPGAISLRLDSSVLQGSAQRIWGQGTQG
jgi:hypothetical protein